IAAVEFDSASPDGVGLVFRREGDQDFWYFLASERNRYHLFGRKAGGTYAMLGEPALDVGFALGARHVLTVAAYDGRLVAELDGRRILEVQGVGPPVAGEVGFLTHGNNSAHFYRARLIELGPT
ncbi:MAG: hypothetical protein IH608_05130, partial [Proteobacteria bacterium]|nr:hypothetical protein [Pseudomonadota bacterium]